MLQRNSVLIFLLFSTLCLCFGQTSNQTLAEYDKEIQVIANAANADQMHELLIDRDKRVMKALEILAKSTPKKEKAPGITIDNEIIQIQVSGSQNKSYLNIEGSINPIILELSSHDRETMIFRLKERGLPERDLEKILEFIPKDFDVNQWQLEEVKRIMGESNKYRQLLEDPLRNLKHLDDKNLKDFLEFQRESSETTGRNLFVNLMIPLSTHGRHVILKFGSQFGESAYLKSKIDNEITQQDLDNFRAALSQ